MGGEGGLKKDRAERTESETLKSCKCEGERLTALKTGFGNELKEHDIRGIKGLVTELKG